MIQRPSPNFNDRNAPEGIRYVVLHYTGMETAQAALERLCNPSAEVSAHYVILEDGSSLQLVEEEKRAWHAGYSFWRGETDLNSLSIGIELVNTGHEFGYRPFPPAQIAALEALLRDIMKRHSLPPSALLAHSDIAPTRKLDPGELFPWEALACKGLGRWPQTAPTDYAPARDHEIENLLRMVGYECPQDDATKSNAARVAFLRRYHPARLTDGFDAESLARLRALSRA